MMYSISLKSNVRNLAECHRPKNVIPALTCSLSLACGIPQSDLAGLGSGLGIGGSGLGCVNVKSTFSGMTDIRHV